MDGIQEKGQELKWVDVNGNRTGIVAWGTSFFLSK